MRSLDDIFAEAAKLGLHINSFYESDKKRWRASWWWRDKDNRATSAQICGSSPAEALEAALEGAKFQMPKPAAPAKAAQPTIEDLF